MKRTKKLIAVLLSLALGAGASVPVFAADRNALEAAIHNTAAYLTKNVKTPQISSMGGEWTVIGLARSNAEVSADYFEKYYRAVEQEVKSKKAVLHTKKYTEYSRVVLALTAIGADPSDVKGYDLLEPLTDVEKVLGQGLNGPAWALLALDSGDYEAGDVRQKYVDTILSKQLIDGGWNLAGAGSADPDITGMVLQALANYTEQAAVKEAVEKALLCLSELQDETGGYSGYGTDNSESVVQVIVALGELGIDLEDKRFVKNQNTLVDALLDYQNKDGSFSHTDDTKSDLMATEQGLYGLTAAQRNMEGKCSLYQMDDVEISVLDRETNPAEKHNDIQKTEVTLANKTFGDIKNHGAQKEIESLASRGIISGMEENRFEPGAAMTRAQFASTIVRALRLPAKSSDQFDDVKLEDWYWSAVGTAHSYGLVSGRTETTFDPKGMISRQEAASMVARAARLCGMDTEMNEAVVQNTLTLFGDYPSVGAWARESVAFCYDQGILDKNDWNIEPARNITRGEIAQMIYHLLEQAELL